MSDNPTLRVVDARVPMRDGVRLATDIVIADAAEPRPVLLVRTPYGRASVWAAHDPTGFARRGWAVVVQDVRGRGQSEGAFRPFFQEIDDGADTIAWCAEQTWSDGRVVMTGFSYNGATQWLAALAHPPALKAISPSVIPTDFLDEFAYEGGAFQQGFLSSWAIGLASSSTDAVVASRSLELVPAWPSLLAEGAGREMIGAAFPDYLRWVPRDEDYWRAVDVAGQLAEVDLPVWRLAGWYDIFCEGTLRSYSEMSARSPSDYARRSQRLIVGPWVHAGMHQTATPEMEFGADAHGLALAAELEDFLRASLDGAPTVSGVTVFVMGENAWRELPSWPPPSNPWALYPQPDGRLGNKPALENRISLHHDPNAPVPTRGGRTLQGGLPVAGPVDQRLVEQRPDVLVWTSEPLEQQVTVIGLVTAQLEVVSDAPGFDLVVKLCDVHPDGRSMNVVDSIQRTRGEPGQRHVVEVQVGSTAMTFMPGHRIRLDVACSNFPRFDLLPASEQTLQLGGSFVVLPVVPLSREAGPALG